MSIEQDAGSESATIPVIGESASIVLAERVKRFNEGLAKLTKETGIGLDAQAHIVDGRIVAVPVIVDVEVKKPADEVKPADESITPEK